MVKCLPGKCEDLSSISRSTTTTTTIQKRNYGQEVWFSVNSAQQLEHLEGSHGDMTWALTCSCVILRTQRDTIKVHECLGGKCGLGRFENEFSGPLRWPEFTTALAAKSNGPSLISRTLKVGEN